jgi:hypothetical protein
MSFFSIPSLNECVLTTIVAQGEQIEASMENGFLIVTFPRPLPEPAPKKIEIQASDKED